MADCVRKWQQAAYLLTIRSISNLVLNLALLPALSTILMQRFGMSPLVKDLFLARASGVTVAIGLLLIALAYTPWILSFGTSLVFCVPNRSRTNTINQSTYRLRSGQRIQRGPAQLTELICRVPPSSHPEL